MNRKKPTNIEKLATKIVTLDQPTQYIDCLIWRAKVANDKKSIDELNEVLNVIKQNDISELRVVPSGNILHLLFTEPVIFQRGRLYYGYGNLARKMEVFKGSFVNYYDEDNPIYIGYLGKYTKEDFLELGKYSKEDFFEVIL